MFASCDHPLPISSGVGAARFDDGRITDAVHQPDAVVREHGLGADGTQRLTDIRRQDRLKSLLGGGHTATTDGAAELLDIRDPPAREGVDDQPAIIEGRDLERLRLEPLDTRVVEDDVLDEGDLEGATRLFLDRADLAELAVQPVAWAIHGGALSEASEPPFDYWDDMGGGSVQDWSADMSYGDHDVAGEELTPVAAGSVQTAQLPDSGAAFWLIEGVNAGDEFSVRMESENLDAMLELFELETGRMVAYNDDYDWMDGLHAQIDFVAREGVTYVARSASWGVSPGEEYALSVMVSADTAEAVTEETAEQVDVPPFGEFIDLVQLVPEFLRTVADGTGELEGFQERRGDTIYSRFVLHNNW